MNETKKMQYYSHELHCKEEIFNWVLNVSLLLTTHFYFLFSLNIFKVLKNCMGEIKSPHTTKIINIKN